MLIAKGTTLIDVPRPDGDRDLGDALALHELLSRYAFLVDERAFERLGEVFTGDVVYDASDFGVPVITGLADLIAHMRQETRHPIAHHVTNVLFDPRGPGVIGVLSTGIGVMRGGWVGSVTYVDTAVSDGRRWRLSARRATLRR